MPGGAAKSWSHCVQACLRRKECPVDPQRQGQKCFFGVNVFCSILSLFLREPGLYEALKGACRRKGHFLSVPRWALYMAKAVATPICHSK